MSICVIFVLFDNQPQILLEPVIFNVVREHICKAGLSVCFLCKSISIRSN